MRTTCSSCNFLTSHCLCSEIKKIDLPFKLIIFRDALEKKHPFNTVNIIKKCIIETDLIDLTKDNEQNVVIVREKLCSLKKPLLLFPTNDAIDIDVLEPEKKLSVKLPEYESLILLDGTWDKTKKILLSSSDLQMIPALKMSSLFTSKYLIRKSNFKGGVSTLESLYYFLNYTHPTVNPDKLMTPFLRFIEIQSKFNC
jgi:DTW domain-containing protein YfiP